MPISVDTVYQKVLALANKEQRGYITPQEFNLFADHAQMEIFEQYFYDLEQRQRGIGSDLDYADIQGNIEEKISHFEMYDQEGTIVGQHGNIDISGFMNDGDSNVHLYRLGMVRVDYADRPRFVQAEQIELKELQAGESPLTRWTKSRPVYTRLASSIGGNRLKVYPNPVDSDRVLISYIRRPLKPNWTFQAVDFKPLYNPGALDHQDFELHTSEESKLVIKILQLAGITTKDYNLAQLAGQKEVNVTQQEKQ